MRSAVFPSAGSLRPSCKRWIESTTDYYTVCVCVILSFFICERPRHRRSLALAALALSSSPSAPDGTSAR